MKVINWFNVLKDRSIYQSMTEIDDESDRNGYLNVIKIDQ